MSKIKDIMYEFNIDSKLKEYSDDFRLACLMVKDYIKKNYKNISFSSKIIILFTVIYVISPIDLIPGFIPILGQLDDISVILFALKMLKSEIDMYRLWLDTKELRK